jgi:hypothetical protein
VTQEASNKTKSPEFRIDHPTDAIRLVTEREQKNGPSEATFCATSAFGPSCQTTPLTVAVADAADSAYQVEWPRAYLPTADSKRLRREDSPASADQPNLVEWRRAYLPIAELKRGVWHSGGDICIFKICYAL